jgi:hypothetical protein
MLRTKKKPLGGGRPPVYSGLSNPCRLFLGDGGEYPPWVGGRQGVIQEAPTFNARAKGQAGSLGW